MIMHEDGGVYEWLFLRLPLHNGNGLASGAITCHDPNEPVECAELYLSGRDTKLVS